MPAGASEGGTGESTTGIGGLSVPLGVHFGELRKADRKADRRFQKERDRRYTELAIEREKALQIKQEADEAALSLARDQQTYKDEKANQLREQIGAERGLYATKDDVGAAIREINATIKPILDFIAVQRGEATATTDALLAANRRLTLLIAFVGIVVVVVNTVIALA